ncbi:MAG TPA: von Willebrand factor type A domain-containing protein [Vicinamibacterales bacterium]|jgi:Ca-activated chloride channel family protein|nr:von Willebrand factor type A domain-containing protein [Vicinamibacterales bacterium]
MRLRRSLVVYLLLVCTLALGARGTGVSVRGVVVDSSGRPLRGATILLQAAGQTVAKAISGADGTFTIPDVLPGPYILRVLREGYDVAEVRVSIQPVAPAPLRFALSASTQAKSPAFSVAEPPDAMRMAAPTPAAPPEFNTAAYAHVDENGFRRATDAPLSTFSIDVDTASYANVRRFLNDHTMPPADAVRVEELINYFHFAYPDSIEHAPFGITTEIARCPWNEKHTLALVGLQAHRLPDAKVPPRNLVFLLDVSGSMQPWNRLPLVKSAMRMLVQTLRSEDRVAIVVYAGASGLALPSTPGSQRERIENAIERLEAGGSTNGAAGIRLAYDTAQQHFIRGGINRVILATDGDFNVGVTSEGELVRLIEERRQSGVFLSVLGVGDDNLKDSTMEQLADKGNGNYSYLDTIGEARRVLIAEAGATLVTVAKDVKIQIEFNPAVVGGYRLVGYEDRLLRSEDFNDDRKDAGEMGAGHSVTALYEIVPPGEPIETGSVDPLKYQQPPRATDGGTTGEIMTVKVRYKDPSADTSRLISAAVRNESSPLTPNLGFAASVAEFGMLLRESPFKGDSSWDEAERLARTYRGEDPDGYRAEFARLVDLASGLSHQQR